MKDASTHSLSWSDLVRPDGSIERKPYLVWGAILFVLKFNINKYLAMWLGAPWLLTFTLTTFPFTESQRRGLGEIPLQQSAILAAVSIPFVWSGIILTLKRLRSVGAPAWLCLLFFVPLLNLLFFLILGILPPRAEAERTRDLSRSERLRILLPTTRGGAAMMALVVTTILGTVLTLLCTEYLESYGAGLFAGVPFMVGFLSVMIISYRGELSAHTSLGIAITATTTLALSLLALGIEGIICIVMAAPFAFILSAMGAGVGYLVQRGSSGVRGSPRSATLLTVSLPLLLLGTMAGEVRSGEEFPLIATTTSVEIDASPEAVWKNVIEFPDLGPPDSWVFLAGIAYPIGARIEGSGVGAVRHCRFSTGPFVEPITVWDPPRLLKFSVTSTPPPMAEWTPYRHLHPPHLENFFESEGGQFLLVPIDGGRTRVEGTTWYRHRIAPGWYWRFFSDQLIHRIHRRVLEHVKRVSESKPSSATE